MVVNITGMVSVDPENYYPQTEFSQDGTLDAVWRFDGLTDRLYIYLHPRHVEMVRRDHHNVWEKIRFSSNLCPTVWNFSWEGQRSYLILLSGEDVRLPGESIMGDLGAIVGLVKYLLVDILRINEGD